MKHFFYKLTQIKPNEVKGALVAFLFIFMLMASYMIAKPVRDALASDFTDTEVAKLWTKTFMYSTVAVLIYNLLATRVSLRKLVPGVFLFFALTFILTALALTSGFDPVIIGKFFYVWTSVFALFHISVFWSFMSQLYSKEQSKRVFAFINTGASVGAITGPLLVILFVKDLPLEAILFITSGVLIAVVPLISVLNKTLKSDENEDFVETSKLSSNPFTGIQEFITHKRLIGIAAFIFIFVGIGSFFYLAQKDILSSYTRAERTEILGQLDLYVNTLTILLGVFATNRIASKFGLSTALGIVPIIVAGALVLFATSPTVVMFLVLQVLRKAGNYSITRPSREILFTGVDKEARFKTKPFIDVAIYRGGDVFWGWFFVALGTEGISFLGIPNMVIAFSLNLPQKLLVGAVIAVIWAILGYVLGKLHERGEKELGQIEKAT